MPESPLPTLLHAIGAFCLRQEEHAILHDARRRHLRHRNQELEFWHLVGSMLPDWEARKAWLDRNEHMLGWEKVEPTA